MSEWVVSEWKPILVYSSGPTFELELELELDQTWPWPDHVLTLTIDLDLDLDPTLSGTLSGTLSLTILLKWYETNFHNKHYEASFCLLRKVDSGTF